MLVRSFAVQAVWNYETLVGTGFAYCLLPALRRSAGADHAKLEVATKRHAELFNGHPYLVPVAVGAVARLEADGVPPEMVHRFKDALRGPLGSLGDRLFWLGWRPSCALFALGLLLLGVPWWIAVAAFLLVYNALHLYVRAWGLRVGFKSGLQVAAVLRGAALERAATWVARLGALLAGGVVALAAVDAHRMGAGPVAVVFAVVAGLALGARTRAVVWVGLTAVWLGSLAGLFASFA